MKIKRELSQENVTNMIGISQACLVGSEKGIICILTSNLYKMSKKYKISLSELCEKIIK